MGKTLYLSDEAHTKLKMVSAARDKDMKEVVEEFIYNIDCSEIEQAAN